MWYIIYISIFCLCLQLTVWCVRPCLKCTTVCDNINRCTCFISLWGEMRTKNLQFDAWQLNVYSNIDNILLFIIYTFYIPQGTSCDASYIFVISPSPTVNHNTVLKAKQTHTHSTTQIQCLFVILRVMFLTTNQKFSGRFWGTQTVEMCNAEYKAAL